MSSFDHRRPVTFTKPLSSDKKSQNGSDLVHPKVRQPILPVQQLPHITGDVPVVPPAWLGSDFEELVNDLGVYRPRKEGHTHLFVQPSTPPHDWNEVWCVEPWEKGNEFFDIGGSRCGCLQLLLSAL